MSCCSAARKAGVLSHRGALEYSASTKQRQKDPSTCTDSAPGLQSDTYVCCAPAHELSWCLRDRLNRKEIRSWGSCSHWGRKRRVQCRRHYPSGINLPSSLASRLPWSPGYTLCTHSCLRSYNHSPGTSPPPPSIPGFSDGGGLAALAWRSITGSWKRRTASYRLAAGLFC